MDFAFPVAKVAIECDGDYWHANPRFYTEGPEHQLQRQNVFRDKRKDEYAMKSGWTLLRYWECDINATTYKDNLLCKLRESGLLNESD